MDRRQSGRLRISFLGWSVIATALIIVSAIAIPNFFRAKMTDDEETPARDGTLVTAEISFAASNPKAGFTCNLSDLADLIGSKLASGHSVGYVLAFQNCRSGKASRTDFEIPSDRRL